MDGKNAIYVSISTNDRKPFRLLIVYYIQLSKSMNAYKQAKKYGIM